MNERDVASQLRRAMEHNRNEEQQRYQEASLLRLQRIIEKKMTTTFIGALARFETYFGQLWGHRRDRGELSEQELAWRELWEQCRTEVLNNGNNQLRAVEAELALYTVWWKRHQLNLPVAGAAADVPSDSQQPRR